MKGSLLVAVIGCFAWVESTPRAAAQGAWVQQGKVTPSSVASSQQEFGASIASYDGWLLAGSFEEGGTGSAYLFELQGSSWVETHAFYPSMGLYDDEFGAAVALARDVAVVGAPSAFDSGTVCLFEGGGSTWTEVACFELQPLLQDARFGAAVAVSGDIALVGAPGISSAYVLERITGVWTSIGELVPAGPAPREFGASIAFDGTRAVIGAPDAGSAHVFERSAGIWSEVAVLVPDDPELDRFGAAVALSGDEILVGAPDDDGDGGAVLYAFGPLGWNPSTEWKASSAASSLEFGSAVALGTNLAVVGAPGDEDSGILGSAYVYERMGPSWVQTAELLPDVGPGEGTFGSSLALVDPYVLVHVGLNESGVLGYAGAINVWVEIGPSGPTGRRIPDPW